MKVAHVLAVVSLVLGCATGAMPAVAQDSTAVAAPDSAVTAPAVKPEGIPSADIQPNVFYYVKGERLIKVEETPIEGGTSVDAGSVAKMAAGFGGPKNWMVLAGETSIQPIAETQPRFRIACERSLALMLRLGAFEVKDGKRRAQVDVTKQLDIFKKGVPVTVEKHAEGVWDIVPAKPLPPGEYAFSVGYGNPVCDFTVVGADTKPEKH